MDFYKKLLEKTDNQVLYVEPSMNKEGIVNDFIVKFATENLVDMLGVRAEDTLERRLSVIFPQIRENGIFEIIRAAYSKGGLQIDFEREIEYQQQRNWYSFKASKFQDGVCLVCENISSLKKVETNLKEANEHLLLQNETLKQAEKIGKSAYFRWEVKRNLWDYSGNFEFLFPQIQKNKNFTSFFDCLEPKDELRIRDAILATNFYGDLERQLFSIYKNNKVRHFSLWGYFTPTKTGQLMIGVVQDITETIENEQILILKNEELELTNHELDSFNHIASHDLQEPLRKVQMFISRLSDNDKDKLSEKGMLYLEKIEDSTNRMQYLIRHLLTYSRIGKKKEDFSKQDTKHIIQRAICEFEETYKTKAIVSISNIPDIEGVKFLLEQLFNNIISNIFKYQDSTRELKIDISHEIFKVDLLDSLPDNITDHTSFVKLKIQDNGIGFQDEYSDRIFEPFQRLHKRDVYKGTGIGLAICKKIVDAHGGNISAKGILGGGTTILLELPLSQQKIDK